MNRTDAKLTPPFLVQMCSGESNQHCDVFPHGSIHEVQKDEDGILHLVKRIDAIPLQYKTKVVEVKPITKDCDNCKREYPENWPFITYRKNTKTSIEKITTCVRCYEKTNMNGINDFKREEYRQALRDELKIEMGL